MVIIGVDTGGTFTDFVFKQGPRWGVYKVLSTPSNPATAVLEGLAHVGGDRAKQVIHGSTVATNAILERKGAKTALITNTGFTDVIEIGRQNRSRIYDLAYQKEPHIVPPSLRFGVKGRILHTGEVPHGLDETELLEVARHLQRLDIKSVAVCLLFSYLNPSHEEEIREILKPTGIPVSLSHEVLSEFREFERTSTTVVNAYVAPKMQKYIRFLTGHLGEGDTLSIMQSNGGSISSETAMRESVRTILSGPAGGVVGALELGKMAGLSKLITFDMGGTSTDVSLIDGELSVTMESKISGYPLKVPMINIHTVGAGGGSIASLDVGRSLKVGPESAGAHPGPICYGRGEEVTVTDANLYLGRLIPEHFLGGALRLEGERLTPYFQDLAAQAGLTALELAEGILAVANTAMEKAIRVISVERGHDPQGFTLFTFGGAGAMHGAFLARLLGIPKVLVPQNPGILSAMGMIMADVIKDYSLTIMKNQAHALKGAFHPFFVDMEEKAARDLAYEGVPSDRLFHERYLDMRYEGQSYEIMVPFEGDYIEGFHSLHEKTYGYRNDAKAVDIVNIRLRARGIPDKPHFPRSERGEERPGIEALLEKREVIFEQKALPTEVFAREKLVSGNRITGPAVVVEYSATTVIPPFAQAWVDDYGNLIMEITG